MRIVLVDDVAPVRRLLRELLTDAGHSVVGEAPDGCAGVREAVALRPDLVVMDWSMPEMDGIAATREIRARCPAVAVIAYSSAADPAVREAFRAAGAVDYVDKADVDGLLSAIAAVADSHPGDPTAAPVDRFGLEVRTWRALARTTIAARGPLRRDAGATLAAAVAEHARAGGTIVLDLSEITAIDEHGVAAIDRCARSATAADARLEIDDPSPIARRALRRSGP